VNIREKTLLAAGLIIIILVAPTTYSVLMLRKISTLAAAQASADARAGALAAQLANLFDEAQEYTRLLRVDPDFARRLDTNLSELSGALGALRESSEPPVPALCDKLIIALEEFRELAPSGAADDAQLEAAEFEIRRDISQIATALRRLAGKRTNQAERLAEQAATFTITSSAIGIVVAVVLWLTLVRALGRPLKDLVAGTEKIARGEFDELIPVRADDELGKLAQSFNQMADALGDLEKMKADFLSAASHGLRTPLACAKGHISSMISERHAPLGAETRKTLGRIEGEIDRVSRFVDQLLDLGRLRSGRLTLSMRDLPAAAFFKNIGRSFDGLADEKGIRYKVDVMERLPARFTADPDRLGEALTNLLDNAFKYTPSGGSVGLLVTRDEEWVLVKVSDSGPGIPADEAARIFERYYRGGAVSADGAGLGLAITRGIVERHGGSIWLEGAGPGAEFAFKVPLKASDIDGAGL
jgi:signal transduction histidine kinase